MIGERSGRRQKWLLVIAITSLLIFGISYLKLKQAKIPRELVGTWKTTNGLYADRSMEIGGDDINFVTGGGTQYTGFIDNIRSIAENGKTLYTISYSVNGMPSQLSFYYDDANGGTIQFKNQEHVVWNKVSGS